MMVDPPRGLGAPALCGDASALRPERIDGRLRLLTVFCAGDYVESEVAATMPAVQSPEDPAFGRMIGAVMRDLVPDRDPSEEADCPIPPC